MTFREVYDEHFRFVWRSLRRLGVGDHDAADAVQEVFVVVHRRLGDFEGRSKMSTWLFGICMRVAASRKRATHLRCEVPADDAKLAEPPDDGADIVSETERRQRLAFAERILGQLPLEQRAVFSLFELEGLPGVEIAELLDIPVGTVRSRLRLARETFREVLHRERARDDFRFAAKA